VDTLQVAENESGEKGRIGVDTDAVLMGISDCGYYLTEAIFED
jgi:hypothetical protein